MLLELRNQERWRLRYLPLTFEAWCLAKWLHFASQFSHRLPS